ncbi:MAG TPA: hypothetical protein VHJ38_15805, partial [Nitrososphaeraceae archaeon]|nr:hypothetical protein [Nitrososphaeraceae archaeon]
AFYVKEFNLTAAEDTNKAFILSVTFHAGAHRWFVFLKPLPPRDHTIFYMSNSNYRTSSDTTANFADITCQLHVN